MRGINYFPVSVDFFSEKRTRILSGRYGLSGVFIYFRLLSEIYKDFGYYMIYDDDMRDLLAEETKENITFIDDLIVFLVVKGFFDDRLFFDKGVLTSLDIQTSFQRAVEARGRKRSVFVDSSIWLLPCEDTKNYIKFDNFGNDVDIPRNLLSDSMESDSKFTHYKVKESEVKESKVKESKVKECKVKECIDWECMDDLNTLSSELKPVVINWLNYRKEKNDLIVGTSLVALISLIKKNSSEFGDDKVIALINDCIARGWKGIIWERLEKQTDNKNSVKKNRFVNYEQRNWDFDKLEKLERRYIQEKILDSPPNDPRYYAALERAKA